MRTAIWPEFNKKNCDNYCMYLYSMYCTYSICTIYQSIIKRACRLQKLSIYSKYIRKMQF